MTRKTILLLGSSGFIGKNLSEALKAKYILLTPSRKELDLTNQISTFKFFKNNKIDIVINCVIVGGSRREEFEANELNVNLRIFFNIVNNSKYYKKLIHLGSGAEYDKSYPLMKIKEEDFGKRIPQDNYGLFKYVCSKYIEQSENIINLRIFGLFGKYEDYSLRFPSYAIRRNLSGLPIEIKQNVFFDYVYVDDFVKILEYFIENKGKYKVYNIGRGKRVDILSIAKMVNKIGVKTRITIDKKGLNREYTCDNSRLLGEIKNLRLKNIEDSLKDLYQWYKNQAFINE